MIDIEKLKQAALISNGEPMLISASEVLELITRLEAAETSLASQEIVIQQLRDALEKIACVGNGNTHGNSVGNCLAIEALAIPTSTKHLEAWYREQVGEPTCYHFRDDPEKFAMPGSGYSHDYPTDALDVVPLHAIKPFPFKEK